MKPGWALLVSGLIIMAVGVVWLIAGMIWAGTPPVNPPPATPVPTLVPERTGATPVASPPVPSVTTAAVTETPASLAASGFSSDDVKLHFLDLAFGAGNAFLERLDPDVDNGRIILSVTANSNADLAVLERAAKEFNGLSRTNQISENIKQGPNGDIAIKFIPESGMGGIVINTSDSLNSREFRINDTLAAKISRGTIYINANLKGDVRNYTLIHCLYYQLGFVGATEDYPDSLFYTGQNTNANLSYIDRKAVEVMYATGLAPGMTVDDVKKAVYIR